MSEPLFTPGPWRASEGNAYNSRTYVMVGGETEICEVFDDSDEMALPDIENAQLIAAAPELYEVARLLIERTVAAGAMPVDDEELEQMAREALAKAEGRS